MSTRKSASLDGSLLARKGDAMPAVPESPRLRDAFARPQQAAPPSDGGAAKTARLTPMTTSRRGLAVLVLVALVAAVAIAAERWLVPGEEVATAPEVSPVPATPVSDTVVADTSPPAAAMPPAPPAVPSPVELSSAESSSAEVGTEAPPVPFAPPADRGDTVRAAVVSDAPAPARPPKKPAQHVRKSASAMPAVTAGPYILQLAAFSSATSARGEAARLQKKLNTVLGERRVVVVKAASAGKPPVWRLRASGYATLAAARAACVRIRKMKAGCWVIRR